MCSRSIRFFFNPLRHSDNSENSSCRSALHLFQNSVTVPRDDTQPERLLMNLNVLYLIHKYRRNYSPRRWTISEDGRRARPSATSRWHRTACPGYSGTQRPTTPSITSYRVPRNRFRLLRSSTWISLPPDLPLYNISLNTLPQFQLAI